MPLAYLKNILVPHPPLSFRKVYFPTHWCSHSSFPKICIHPCYTLFSKQALKFAHLHGLTIFTGYFDRFPAIPLVKDWRSHFSNCSESYQETHLNSLSPLEFTCLKTNTLLLLRKPIANVWTTQKYKTLNSGRLASTL